MKVLNPIINFNLRSTYFSLIRSGKKVVEGRLKKPTLDSLKVHDLIRFYEVLDTKEDQKLTSRNFLDVRVTHLRQYPTFRAMLEQEGLRRCLPNVETLDKGEEIYYSFPGYREDEKIYGVLAIGIHLIKDASR